MLLLLLIFFLGHFPVSFFLLGVLHCLTSALSAWMWLDWILLDDLVWWLIRIWFFIACDHALISIKWCICIITLIPIIMHNNTLVHDQTSIWIKASHVLEIVHLALEKSKIIC